MNSWRAADFRISRWPGARARNIYRPFGFQIHSITTIPHLHRPLYLPLPHLTSFLDVSFLFLFFFIQNCFSADYCFHRAMKKNRLDIETHTGENLCWLCGYWFCWTRKRTREKRKKTNVWQNDCISFGSKFSSRRLLLPPISFFSFVFVFVFGCFFTHTQFEHVSCLP